MNTTDKLNQLSETYKLQAEIQAQKQAALDALLTPEIKQEIAVIEAEFNPLLEKVLQNIANWEKEIKLDVRLDSKTVKGTDLEAVYCQGRVTWDNKALDGYMVAHPEIKVMRKEGDPYVIIREVHKAV